MHPTCAVGVRLPNPYENVPETLRNALNPQYIGRVTSVLAGGQTIEEELYQVNFHLCLEFAIYQTHVKTTIVWTILSFLETKSRKEGILSVYIFYS